MTQKGSSSPAGISGSEWALLWGATLLLQYLSQLEWILSLRTPPFGLRDLFDTLVVLFSAALLLSPKRSAPLLLAAASQIAAAALHLPDIPNHRIFSALVNISLLLAAFQAVPARASLDLEGLWLRAAPTVRGLIGTLYLFAGLVKVNTGYLNPEYSCAVAFLREMQLPFHLPAAVEQLSAASSIVIELGLPALLLLPRSRPWGILIGLLFHLALSFDTSRHFLDFSSVATACLLAYSSAPVLSGSTVRRLGVLLVIGGAFCIASGSHYPEMISAVTYGKTKNLLWLFYAATVIGSYVLSFSAQRAARPVSPCYPPFGLLAIPVLIAFANGATPYLGLKTRTSWDMYSNLRVEGRFPNHLIFGGGLDLLGELREPISIVESSNERLRREFIAKGYDIVPFELRKIFADDPSGRTTFYYRGERYTSYPHGTGDLPLSRAPSSLARYLLWFRAVDTRPEPRCGR